MRHLKYNTVEIKFRNGNYLKLKEAIIHDYDYDQGELTISTDLFGNITIKEQDIESIKAIWRK